MEIKLKEISIRKLVQGYEDNGEGGVVGYDGKLDIRPPYQREFVYKPEQQSAVVETVNRNFPLNVMYWAVREDGGLEVIDGQQRILSICEFIRGDLSVGGRYFHNLESDERDKILDYDLMVYFCSGTDSEKLKWFETINIAGEKLTDQELRNAVFHGPWVTDAKRYFSKTGGPAYEIGGKYLSGTAIRQDYLETVIKWISNGDIDDYMATRQQKSNANDLRLYFGNVIGWIEANFHKYRQEMKKVPWGDLYNVHKDDDLDPETLEREVSRLMEGEDVRNKKGIYSYVLDGKEKHLNIRTFSKQQKREAYERQKGICRLCGEHFVFEAMEGDHITPWHEGGKTDTLNCQMLCRECNRRKSGR